MGSEWRLGQAQLLLQNPLLKVQVRRSWKGCFCVCEKSHGYSAEESWIIVNSNDSNEQPSEPNGNDGLANASGIPFNPYSDPPFQPQEEINPFSPPSATERPATQGLGFGYWVPIAVAVGACVYGASISSQIGMFGLAAYILAAVHGVRYQYRLSQRERAGLPLRRQPDFVVFVLSSVVGTLGVFGSFVAFFTVCFGSVTSIEALGTFGPGFNSLGFVFIAVCTVIAIIAAILVPSLLTRLFLPKKPSAEKNLEG